jgi:uncharacterized protein YPO0396
MELNCEGLEIEQEEFDRGYSLWANSLEEEMRWHEEIEEEETNRINEINSKLERHRIKRKEDIEDFIACLGMSEYERGIYNGGERRGR